MVNKFLNISKALYINSPQTNIRKIFEKLRTRLASNRNDNIEELSSNDVIGELLRVDTFADIFAYKIQLLEKQNYILLGDKATIDSWDLSSKCSDLSITVIDWNWSKALDDSKLYEDNCVIICKVPMCSEEWLSFSNLRKKYKKDIFTIVEFLLPFTRISVLQKKLDYWIKSFDEILPYYFGFKYFGPLEKLNQEFNLVGKGVIEFGPFDGCQTAGLVNLGVKSVDCIEVRSENVTKTLAAAAAFNWENVRVIMDDFHDVNSIKYGRYDLVFAHGVYYHSIAPFLFLENLLSLSDNIFIGGYCATEESPPEQFTTLSYQGIGYRVKRFKEVGGYTAGVNTYGYFFHKEDLIRFFIERGYDIKVISDEPEKVVAGRYLRFLAQKTQK